MHIGPAEQVARVYARMCSSLCSLTVSAITVASRFFAGGLDGGKFKVHENAEYRI